MGYHGGAGDTVMMVTLITERDSATCATHFCSAKVSLSDNIGFPFSVPDVYFPHNFSLQNKIYILPFFLMLYLSHFVVR